MKKIFQLFCKSESGNVVVIFAFSITCLLGMTAAVIDGGRLYQEKSVLQNAMDAAALAGAQELLTSSTSAASIAEDIASKNSFPESNINTESDSIKVSKSTTVPMTFAKILGINEVPIAASAKAKVGQLKSSKGITPIAVVKSALPEDSNNPSKISLKCEGTQFSPGNCGYLDLSASGASGLEDGIINGSRMPVSEGSIVDTETGVKWGPVKTAFDTLINNDASKPQCQSLETADNSCSRLIFVPIINSWDDINGKDSVKVLQFAAFWVSNVENSTKSIYGYFKRFVTPGEIGGSGPGTLYGVKLVE